MPVYEYKCRNEKCGKTFEKVRQVGRRKEPGLCPHCDESLGDFIEAPKPDVKTNRVRNVFDKV